MNLEDALQTFIIEGRDLLQQMEEALLQLEKNPDDTDCVNAIFRAAHTIKGSSGLFGLDFVVDFTHVAESVLDRVRSGEIAIDEKIIALFLQVGDHIGSLIDHVAEHTTPNEDTETVGSSLIQQLNIYLDAEPNHVQGDFTKTAKAPLSTNLVIETEQVASIENAAIVESDNWHISIRFGADTFRNGMDPFSFVRYMKTLGTIVHIVTITDALPSMETMDVESCYLGLEISFKSGASKQEIESVFDFIQDDSKIHILPPRSKVAEYISLIQTQSDNEMKLGEILVQCGTLTQVELEKMLAKQAKESPDNKLIGQVLVEENLVEPAVIVAALEKQKQVKDTKTSEANLIRVDANKLDQLINMVGELIIAGASANLTANKLGITEMTEATSVISDLVEQVRDSALSLRMVQIGATFSRFQRVVRDVSKELGKDIRLEISGEDTELDKTVVEKIADPLTHLVRNSIDHGIESAEVRVANGKAAYGTLKLNALHDSGSIVIEVSDDGAGLNRDRILAKAIERGLVKDDHQLTDNEIYNLIFEAGFSTKDEVSNLSGRGVGMDVVRRNIQDLRGTVTIHSEFGKGARMRIRLPLTLAIIDGFLVNVGGSEYVIPLDMVVECIELSADGLAESQANGSNIINLRGEVLPYLRLREQFECEGEPPTRQNVVVVQYGEQKIGLVVDKLLGEFQTVIKPLSKVFGHVKGIGGFTILGSGSVALILDVPRMMEQANLQGNQEIEMI
jgi:two-component system chemotaxis sensor kinase CheA